VPQREGSKNKHNRRRRQTEKRVTVAVPVSSLRNTVGIAVRIHGGRHAAPEIKSELRELGLVRKYDAVFVNLNAEGIGKDSTRHVNAYSPLRCSSFETPGCICCLRVYISQVCDGVASASRLH
jgi:hypothetical protein